MNIGINVRLAYKLIWSVITMALMCGQSLAESCNSCNMEYVITNNSLPKYGFPAYMATNPPIVHMFHQRRNNWNADTSINMSRTNTDGIIIDTSEYFNEGVELTETVYPLTGAYTNIAAGSAVGWTVVNIYDATNKLLINDSQIWYGNVQIGDDSNWDEDQFGWPFWDTPNFLTGGLGMWVFQMTDIENYSDYDYSWFSSATNYTTVGLPYVYPFTVLDSITAEYDGFSGFPMQGSGGGFGGDARDGGSGILNQWFNPLSEYKDDKLFNNLLTIMPTYTTNWVTGVAKAYSTISDDHVTSFGQKMLYRFKLPPRTETNRIYMVTWDIKTISQLNSNSDLIVSIKTNNVDFVKGTGNPSNYIYTAEHELDVPLFYCSTERGGTNMALVENIKITQLNNDEVAGAGQSFRNASGGCSQCGTSSSDPIGASDGSLVADFSLGQNISGQLAGMLNIWSAKPKNNLPTTGGLRYLGDTNSVVVIKDTGGNLRQILAPQSLADIVTITSTKYEIRYYFLTNVIGPLGGLYQSNGAPFVTWTVENPFSGTTNFLRITETRGGSRWENNYVYTNQGWAYTSPGNLSKIEVSSPTNYVDGLRTVTAAVSQPGGLTNFIVTRKYKKYAWGEGLVLEIVGSGANAKKTSWTYDPSYSANGSFLPVQMKVDQNGSWTYYKYTTLANGITAPSDVYSGFGDEPPPAGGTEPTGANTRHIHYEYSLYGGDDGAQEPESPRMVVEYVNASEISRNYLVLLPGERRDIRRVHVGDGWNAADNLVTVTKYYTNGPNLYKPQSIVNPDGTAVFYNYFSSTNGWQTNTVSTGQPNGSGTDIYEGSITTTILDPFGQKTKYTVEKISAGTLGAALQQDVYGNFDLLDRAQLVTHLDNTKDYFNYACCYLESTTNRDGVFTYYLHDVAKRACGQEQFINNTDFISYQNILDAAGRTTQTRRIGTDSTVVTTSLSMFDTAGQLIASTNALGGTTTYADTTNSNGALIRSTTYPDGGTRIQTYYLDGNVKSETGTAVHGKAYGYGAGYDVNGNACSFTVETNLDASGVPTGEWTKTYTDMSGRITETQYSDAHYSQSIYNSHGQLWMQVDPDGVTTLFQYNGQGELANTAVSMTGSSATNIDWEHDRITSTTNDVTIDHGKTVRRTRIYVWPETGVNASKLQSVSETSVDGLNSWQINFGDSNTAVTNQSATSYSGISRTVIANAPDGSYVLNTISFGRIVSSINYDSNGIQIAGTSYSYDAHGRLYQVTDARNGTTTYGYNDADQVNSVTTPVPGAGQAPEVTTTLFDNMLRPYCVIQPDGTTVNSVFLTTGELGLQYGSRTYPVAYSYDYAGRMQTMTNWSDFAGPSGARVTTWKYDGSRGWLTNKVFAGSNGPSYKYTAAGRLQQRSWARGITASYAHDIAGSLTNVSYNDGITPAVGNSYDRLGRVKTVVWTNITASLTYNLASQVLNESFTGGALNGISVTNGYDNLLRRTNLTAKGASFLTRNSYGYDAASRLSTVKDGSNNVATYSYIANSPLVSQIAFTNGTSRRMATTKSYDYLNRLTKISTTPPGAGAGPVTFNYTYNQANQRTKNILADGSFWIYAYDSLGQVTSGKKYFFDGTPVPGQQFGYAFDDIGNRTQTQTGGDEAGANLRLASYSVNNLNQITSRDYPGTNDVIGVAVATNAVTVNGQTAWRKGEYYWATVKSNNTAAAQWEGVSVVSGGNTNKGNLFVPKTPEQFSYDADGNLTNDGHWSYTWDAENRLIKMTNNTGAGPKYGLSFAYDAQGRRIQKLVATNGVGIYTNRLLYDGWNLVAEVGASGALVRSYVWGIDLSGSLQDAGGVGGLLEVSCFGNGTTSITNCFPAFDGNGNMATLVNAADGTVSANYEYGPFGELLRATGPMAKANPLRFATQYYDDETDLIMYPRRPYIASTGRWLSRDPIEEDGGENLYIFCGNDSLNNWDLLGEKWKVQRDGGVKAQAIPEQGDTINELASIIGLNPADYQQWLTVSSGNMPSSASESLNGCGNFQIPNEAIAYWGGDVGAIGRWWVSWNSNVRYLKARGFYVDEVRASPATQTADLQNQLEASDSSKTLHGLYFWGHGNVQGIGSRKKFPLVNYGDTTLPTIHLNYKMALALVYACESDSGKPYLSSGTAGSIWHGYPGILYPVNPWRTDFKVKTYLHKGAQATKL